MPGLPQTSGKRLVRALGMVGWVVHHQRGSHAVLKHPDRPGLRVVVPCHSKLLKKGTLAAILRDANLTGDQLRDLL